MLGQSCEMSILLHGAKFWNQKKTALFATILVLLANLIREGSKKKKRKKCGHLPNRGGGPEVYINNQPPSAIMCFFKWACKTILGPPKHVLHLDWSVYVTFKTIKIALKVEL